ncbi:unnamed protein product [Lactuca virosa]|uniref:Uncharacterized protein n=1 Tax=Lactuca virosa TaxID=75947 RepID=A0AAU9PIR1_9ASTR|nr:unnamed protein product [Lactuca virosa]
MHSGDAGALPRLGCLLKRHLDGQSSLRALNGAIRKAADAITNLAHENCSIKTLVRVEGGIPPLVDWLESSDAKCKELQRGPCIVECNALPTLVLMLHSEDAAIHYEASTSPLIQRNIVFYLSLRMRYWILNYNWIVFTEVDAGRS